ncbi:hypothetical protein [Abyssalbus ytuae]|uniref:Uncharacterized protein n=1 Tax=Abyssalbus ytuae TaxID=2926907 RepID=A0A9E7D3H6_9FLAO|nr:hypothetical protein [Abyssalbus ytuae]UOB17859.1 hypothetical protein MQE35_00845 [Abyssalbus ytuae]
MSLYQHTEQSHLEELFEKSPKLTYTAKIELKNELEKRKIIEVEPLVSLINYETDEIKSLKFLEDIGFTIKKNDDGIIITRTKYAITLDIIAVILGLILVVAGIFNLVSAFASFFSDSNFNMSGFLINILFVVIGGYGFKMLSGINRLLEFSGFKLIAVQDIITLQKRFDLKLQTVERSKTDLKLVSNSTGLMLELDDIEVFSANPESPVQTLTMKALYNHLKSS